MRTLKALFAGVLVFPVFGADYVVSSSTGGVLQGYPVLPPAGSFIEVVQLGNYQIYPLKVNFSDGRSSNQFRVRNDTAGFKMIGVSSITPITIADHTILWKITPAVEFAKAGAIYQTIRESEPGLPDDVYVVPPNSIVRVIDSNEGTTHAVVSWVSSVAGLSVSGVAVPTPSPAYPFLTSIRCSDFVLLEITPARSPLNLKVSVQQSKDLRDWETLYSFQIAPTQAKEFFRAIIAAPTE